MICSNLWPPSVILKCTVNAIYNLNDEQIQLTVLLLYFVHREFLIFAPKVVRPLMVYEVHVTLNRKYFSNMSVTALLSSNGNEYANGAVGFNDVGTKVIQLQVDCDSLRMEVF